ncbi:TlpA disulfide reductase family protein [Algoriphagus sp. Y33]|uniref:TlpA family protein disulfide reductase n=1 Tax=Algoriphagus sp. Y33 TaxID=2772483 RepID=UPI00177E4CD5|nr:TlpA disulfide reductase family protein [Algoriphagus sp. Y33]
MKKNILICLVGLLCLPTSTLPAQVADSPGADFLHRSSPIVSPEQGDTHRGGETRSDTLPEDFDLVDHSGQGQEGEGSSASVVGFFTLKGEIRPSADILPPLHYELRELELDSRYDYATILQDTLPLGTGQFFTGTGGMKTFQVRLPLGQPIARLHLLIGNQPLLEDIWVQPGDSLSVRYDRKSGRLLFSGPQAGKARLQLHLQEAARSAALGRNPVMILSDAAAMIGSPEREAQYRRVEEAYLPGWTRKMEWLETDADRMKRAGQLLEASGASHPVFGELARYKGELDPEFHRWLSMYWTGRLRGEALEFASYARPKSDDWGELLLRHGMDRKDLALAKAGKTVPAEWAESVYLENRLLEQLTRIPFFNLTATLPPALRDQVDGLYLIREHKNLPQADSLIVKALNQSENPWVAEYLDRLYRGNLAGREILNRPFIGEDGHNVYPESWKGKLVFMDFWLSGCGACLKFAKSQFLPLMEKYKDHPDILFVTVSGDNDRARWKKSLAGGLYTSAASLDLYSGGTEHPVLRQYQIQSFPAQLLLDSGGKILRTGNFPDTLEGWDELVQTCLNRPVSEAAYPEPTNPTAK